jgi:hypothetical protein
MAPALTGDVPRAPLVTAAPRPQATTTCNRARPGFAVVQRGRRPIGNVAPFAPQPGQVASSATMAGPNAAPSR